MLVKQYVDLEQGKNAVRPEDSYDIYSLASIGLKASDPLRSLEEIKKGDKEIGFMKASPGSSRIFFVEGTDYNLPNGVAKILNHLEVVTAIQSNPVKLRTGTWVDYDTIAFVTRAGGEKIKESVCLYNFDGTKTVLTPKEGYISDVNSFGGILYYITVGTEEIRNEVIAYDSKTGKQRIIIDVPQAPFVQKIFPSPRGDRLALLMSGTNKKTGQYESTLLITDLDGNQKLQVKSSSMFTASWTPDGKGILYERRTTPESATDGIYLLDVNSGGSTLIELTDKVPTEYSWSPSGKKLLISKYRTQYETTVVYFD